MSDFQQLIDDRDWSKVLTQLPEANDEELLALCEYFMGYYHKEYNHELIDSVLKWIAPVKIGDDTFDQYLLHYAVAQRDTAMIKKIIIQRPNVLLKDGADGWFTYLNGVLVGIRDHGKNPEQSIEVLQELLLHFQDNDASALLTAIETNNQQCIDLLLPKSNLRAYDSNILCEVLFLKNDKYITMILEQQQCLFVEALYQLKHPQMPRSAQDTEEVKTILNTMVDQCLDQNDTTLQGVSCQLWKSALSDDLPKATYWCNLCDDQKVIYLLADVALEHQNVDLAILFLSKLEQVDSSLINRMRNTLDHEYFMSCIEKTDAETIKNVFHDCVYYDDYFYATVLSKRFQLEDFHQESLEYFIEIQEFFEEEDFVSRFQFWLGRWENEKILSSLDMPEKNKERKKI